MQLAKTILAGGILLLFMAISMAGLGMSMMTDAQGHMGNCPLMNGLSSICKMNVFEHLASWQSLFVSLAPNILNLSLALFSLALIFVAFIFSDESPQNIRLESSSLPREQVSLFNPLRIAFARGILHSKIYNAVIGL